MIYKMPFRGEWKVWSDKQLLKMDETGLGEQAELLRAQYEHYNRNRISYFLSHGGGLDFVNDRDSELCIIHAPNQVGKTFHLLAWLILRLIPCDPKWHCFQYHGIKHVEWERPLKAMLCSYEMSVHCRRNLWPKLAELLPDHELGSYSPRVTGKKSRNVNWAAPIVPLVCGSEVHFFAYQQPAEAFESMTYDLCACDEQIPEDLYDAAHSRGTTAEEWQSAIAFTPHKVKGRPDTGRAGWVVRMMDGVYDRGIGFVDYRMGMEDVPSAIVSDKKKRSMYIKHIVKPMESGNQKKIREGRARWFGEPESSEGLVYDSWDTNVHWIDPFPPKLMQRCLTQWTLVRGLDHGKAHPFAGLFGMVSPWGDLVLYREYYEAGRGLEENVLGMLSASGSTRVELDRFEQDDGRVTILYEEKFGLEKYAFSAMDPRSFSSPSDDQAMTLGDKYNILGLSCTKGSGMRNEQAVPLVAEWFECRPDRTHLLVRLGLMENMIDAQGNPLRSAPRLYVFNDMARFRAEIEAYTRREEDERPVDKDDHLMTALKYMILEGPAYIAPEPYIPELVKRSRKGQHTVSTSRYAYT